MQGVCAKTGKRLSGLEHLSQSVIDILTTPIGSRVLRRDYGSQLHELVDMPLDEGSRLRIIAAVATALARWEPRLKVTQVHVNQKGPSEVEVTIEGINKENGLLVTMNRISLYGHQP